VAVFVFGTAPNISMMLLPPLGPFLAFLSFFSGYAGLFLEIEFAVFLGFKSEATSLIGPFFDVFNAPFDGLLIPFSLL
jgi:hypothetical protein